MFRFWAGALTLVLAGSVSAASGDLVKQNEKGDIPNYVGQTFLTSQGNTFGSGFVVVGAKATGKSRIALILVDFEIKYLTNEAKPNFLKSEKGYQLLDYDSLVLNCDKKTYSVYSFLKERELSNAARSFHDLGQPHKWEGIGVNGGDGTLLVQFAQEKIRLINFFNYMCKTALD